MTDDRRPGSDGRAEGGSVRKHLRTVTGSGALRSIGMLQVARLVSAGCGAVTLLLLTRALTREEFGVLALVWSTASLARQVFDSRSSALLIRYCSRWSGPGEAPQRRSVIGLSAGLDAAATVLGAAVLVLGAPWLAGLVLHRPGQGGLLLLGALILLAGTGAAAANAVLALNGSFRAMAVADTSGAVATLALSLPAVLLAPSPETLLLATAGGALVQTALRWHLARRDLRRSGLWTSRRDLRGFLDWTPLAGSGRELRRYVFGTNVLATLKLVKGNLPALYLGIVLTPAGAAPYLLAQRIIERTGSVLDPIHHVTFPSFARTLAAGEPRRTRRTYLRTVALSFVVLAPVVLVFAVLSPWSVPFVFGPQYASAVWTVGVAVAGYAIGATFLTRTALLTAAGELRSLNGAYLAGIALQAVLLVVLVARYGSVGASFALVGFHLTTVGWTLPTVLRVLARPAAQQPTEPSERPVGAGVHADAADPATDSELIGANGPEALAVAAGVDDAASPSPTSGRG